ncbi:MAG TPA: NADP-dependent isocitrate dehydrogenase, partial [Arthrobacter sp.]|nr:NADP-dependent isocitrate dehydrogenase [Arthrobacter sp.]
QNEEAIVGELNAVQGSPVDLAGYYRPDAAKVAEVMRPSATLNRIVAALTEAL